MCGIFGVLYHKTEALPEKEQLTETARLLRHRGPDSDGIYADAGIGLVHTRLSLLDLTPRSNQPFWDREGRYGLVYNGEIYNFKELREDLERRGVRFRTTSDTEVLLECLINDGFEKTLPKLEGMFAFGLYDKVQKVLTVARDRFGIKPVFIYDKDEAFIFASEIQAMRPWVTFRPDVLSISSFLYGFGGPTKGYSFYESIRILSPGSIVTIRKGQASLYSTFFSMPDFFDSDQGAQLEHLKTRQLLDIVEECLLDSVKQQLVADAPVGALCSGGVDSALVLAMAARFHNNLAIFHANVIGPHSEFTAALELAKGLKLDLKAVDVRDQDYVEQFPRAMKHYGHPFYMIPSSIPFLMVSKLISQNGIKAVLTGEGSDECFLGYNFVVPNIRRWRRYTYDVIRTMVRRLTGEQNTGRNRLTEWDTYSSDEVALSSERLIRGLHNRFEVALETQDIQARVRNGDGPQKYAGSWKSLDLLGYNLRALLNRGDSMGMASSIECRFPYLDSRLVKLTVNAPYRYKIKFSFRAFDSNHYFFIDKWVLRKVAERYLPSAICHRSKVNFRVDAYKHINILPGFFEKSFLSELFGLSTRELQYLIDNAGRDLRLRMMHLDVWAQVCLNNQPEGRVTNRLHEYVQVSRRPHALQVK